MVAKTKKISIQCDDELKQKLLEKAKKDKLPMWRECEKILEEAVKEKPPTQDGVTNKPPIPETQPVASGDEQAVEKPKPVSVGKKEPEIKKKQDEGDPSGLW